VDPDEAHAPRPGMQATVSAGRITRGVLDRRAARRAPHGQWCNLRRAICSALAPVRRRARRSRLAATS
jgi:hypothetical protein